MFPLSTLSEEGFEKLNHDIILTWVRCENVVERVKVEVNVCSITF